jgi:hypothetical protein
MLDFNLYEEGWTVAVALGHLAFWDQWSLTLLKKWKESGVSSETVDTNTVNDTLVPLFLAMPPRQVAILALTETAPGKKKKHQTEISRTILS